MAKREGGGGGGVIVDGSEDLLTRRRHKTKATMQILQKQQFTDDNLRQVTSQPEASVTHPLLAPGVGPKLGSCWAPAATCPPTRCVCVFYVNEFIYYYFIFCLLLLVVLLRILWHCRHFQLAYPTLPTSLSAVQHPLLPTPYR